jgi:hypothetical protein
MTANEKSAADYFGDDAKRETIATLRSSKQGALAEVLVHTVFLRNS